MRTTSFPETSLKFLDQPEKERELIRSEFRIYRYTLVVLDLLLTYLAFRVAFFVRFSAGIPFFQQDVIPLLPLYNAVMLAAILIWVAIFALMGLYSLHNLLGGTREYELCFNATILGSFLIVSLGFFFPDELIVARGWVVVVWLTAFLFLTLGRFGLRRMVYALRVKGHFQNRALIVGMNDEGRMLAEQILHWRTSDIRIIGYIDGAYHPPQDFYVKCLGKTQNLDAVIAKYAVSEIILTHSALTQAEILGLFRKYGTARDVHVRMSSGLYEIITTGMQVREYGLVPLVTMNKVRLTGVDFLLKLFMDYLIALPAVILLLPFFALIALAIRLNSPGPIIYRRRVMGVNGRAFDAFKFRTMVSDSEAILQSHPELMQEYQENFKIKVDPRITRLGQFLRKTSIDEFPQLFNVLRNEMSIVGPRMISPEELAKYNQWAINLLTVKPGITGMWQVQGRSDVTYEERVKLDMFYIRNWTIWLDLKLLLQTIPAVIARRGAY